MPEKIQTVFEYERTPPESGDGKFLSLVKRFWPFKDAEKKEELPKSLRREAAFNYWNHVQVQYERVKKYEEYEALDLHVPEVRSALDAFADNAVAGTHGDSFEVTTEHTGAQLAFELLELNTELKGDTWFTLREMCLMGDYFAEVMSNVNSEPNPMLWSITELVRVPPETMRYNVEQSRIQDPSKTFVQNAEGKDPVFFSDAEMVHFRLQGRKGKWYGSSFLEPLRKTIKQWQALEDGLCIAFLLRASNRICFQVPVPEEWDLEEGLKAAKRFLDSINFRSSFNADGEMRTDRIPITPEENIAIPVWPGGHGGASLLAGQTNYSGMLAIVQAWRDKAFAALQIPKSIGGGDASDVNGKNVITRLDVQFARHCRRIQLAATFPYRRVHIIQLALRGIDPKTVKFEFNWPPLGIEDELINWQIKELKAKVAAALGMMYGPPPAKWVYVRLLGLSEEEVEEYGLIPEPMSKEPQMIPAWQEMPQEMIAKLVSTPILREMLRDLRMLVDWKLEWERGVRGRFGDPHSLVGLQVPASEHRFVTNVLNHVNQLRETRPR
jgi:hypothetical protein